MKTISKYLNEARDLHDLTSDYQLAKLLQLRPTVISHYRIGVSYPNDMFAILLADALQIDPMEIIASANYHRAKRLNKSNVARIWMHLHDQVSKGAYVTALTRRRRTLRPRAKER